MKAKCRCCRGEIEAVTRDSGSDTMFVVHPKLEWMAFATMTEMFKWTINILHDLFHAMAGGGLLLTNKKPFSQQQVHIISFLLLYFNTNSLHQHIIKLHYLGNKRYVLLTKKMFKWTLELLSKSGIMRFCVRQFYGKETNGVPMVTDFLLHDASDRTRTKLA
jgi:hypothetical protein